MTKTYILQKDLPDSKAGDKYIWVNSMYGVDAYYLNGKECSSYWTTGVVENNPEWFIEYNPKLYTEEDMRKCFYAPIYVQGGDRCDTFRDYLKTI